MKSLIQHISERLQLNKDRVQKHKYFPETKEELSSFILRELKYQQKTHEEKIDLNCIDTSKITDMSDLFYARSLDFNFDFDVSKWDVSNVRDMHGMFASCEYFNCDLSEWNTSNLIYANYMFANCKRFEGRGLENWDVSNVEDLTCTFEDCSDFNADISSWEVKNVKHIRNIFRGCGINNKILSKIADAWKKYGF